VGAAWFWSSDRATEWRLRRLSGEELEATARERDWDPLVLYHSGLARAQRDDHAGAAAAFARAAGADPSAGRAHRMLGRELIELGRLPEAEAALKRAIAVDPEDGAATRLLGDLYRRVGALAEAIGLFEAVLRREPAAADVMVRLAECYGERYQPDRRLALLERAARHAPDVPRYQMALGSAYFGFGRREEGEVAFGRALERSPDDPELLYVFGRALVEHGEDGQLDEAARMLERAASLRADHTNTRLALGQLHLRRGDLERAREALETATQLGGFEDRVLLLLGQTYQRLGRDADGRRMLAAYRRTTDLSRGIVQLEARLHNVPKDRAARARLVRLYEADGQPERAAYHRSLLQGRGEKPRSRSGG
jgi:tetratricopeptide (TPR) repeat protein